MREFDALSGYPEPKHPRVVSPSQRTIHHWIVASYRDKEFYDGDRNYGYGGFKYDGRWEKIAKKITNEYNLDNKSSFLQLFIYFFLAGNFNLQIKIWILIKSEDYFKNDIILM